MKIKCRRMTLSTANTLNFQRTNPLPQTIMPPLHHALMLRLILGVPYFHVRFMRFSCFFGLRIWHQPYLAPQNQNERIAISESLSVKMGYDVTHRREAMTIVDNRFQRLVQKLKAVVVCSYLFHMPRACILHDHCSLRVRLAWLLTPGAT